MAGQAPAYGQPAPTYGEPAPAYGQPAQAPVSASDARMWALFANLGGIFFSFVAPLVIYLIFKDRDPFIRRHATQALNFQIIVAISFVATSILTMIFFLFFPLSFAVWVCMVVFSIIAAMAANKGEDYTYPLVPQMVT
jgi:uncharacterized Tic20 family protein